MEACFPFYFVLVPKNIHEILNLAGHEVMAMSQARQYGPEFVETMLESSTSIDPARHAAMILPGMLDG